MYTYASRCKNDKRGKEREKDFVYQDVHRSIVYDGKQKQTTQCPTIGVWLNKQWYINFKIFIITNLSNLMKNKKSKKSL